MNGHILCRRMCQIEERIRDLIELRRRLHDLWQKKKEYLDDLYNQQMFLRDVSQLETLSNSQEVCIDVRFLFDVHIIVNDPHSASPVHTRFGNRLFAAAGPRVWNSLPTLLRELDIRLGQFRRALKTNVFGH